MISEGAPSGAAIHARKRLSKRRIALAAIALLMLALAIGYTQRQRYSARLAELSRQVIGDENTARVESWYFAAQDRVDRLKYSVFGGSANPFPAQAEVVQAAAIATPAPASRSDPLLGRDAPGFSPGVCCAQPETPIYMPPPTPAPLVLPQTRQLSASLEAGEGVWSTDGLPRSSPGDVLMAKTFIRPDKVRPYASAGVLLLDKRRIRLHLMGGTEDPGGDRGVPGPGLIPDADRALLLAAWNGGFRGPHGGFGMIADGRQYRPLRNGLASVAVLQDGTIAMGEWGRDLVWSDDMVAVRQNAVLLVDNCEVSRRTAEGNDTWGYVEVNSAEFITWRSAIGLTRNGDLLVAAGNALSADSLARALWAAGACYAMQLDINSPYVLTSLFFQQQDGSVKAGRFMSSMPDSPSRFFATQARDFMYVTLDEARYTP